MGIIRSGGANEYMTTSLRRPLVSLQVLRAIAALGVVFYHVHIIGGQQGLLFGNTINNWAEIGRFGVSLFFVLSGFIICFAHYDDWGKRDRLGRYFWRRVTRIYPIYWIFSLFYVSAALAGIGDSNFTYDAPHILSAITLLHFVESPLPPLLVAWTLFYEMKFYILFGVLIWNRTAGLVVFAIWLAYIGLAYFTGIHDPIRLWTLWNIHFFVGALAFLALDRITPRQAPVLLVLAVLGLVLSVALTDFSQEAIDGPNNNVVVLIAASFALLIAGAARLDEWLAPWCGRALRYLGDASYSLYLVHSAVISLCCIVLRKLHLTGHINPQLAYFAIAACAVIGGCLAHAIVERPLLQAIRRLQPRPTPPKQ